jgi:hypothetical protein
MLLLLSSSENTDERLSQLQSDESVYDLIRDVTSNNSPERQNVENIGPKLTLVVRVLPKKVRYIYFFKGFVRCIIHAIILYIWSGNSNNYEWPFGLHILSKFTLVCIIFLYLFVFTNNNYTNLQYHRKSVLYYCFFDLVKKKKQHNFVLFLSISNFRS